MLDSHIARRFDFQQAVADGQVLNVDLEMDQDLEQRGGGTLSAIHDAPATSVPASRRTQRSLTREGEMVADPPEEHLRRHALVDSVQQLLDEAGACFSGRQLQRGATVELPLGGTQPAPRAFALSENLFTKRGNTGETY